MTTGLQLALLGGALLGLGLALLVLRLLPADPDPVDVVRRYALDARPAAPAAAPAAADLQDRLGLWAMRRLPPAWWGRTPAGDLALLQIPLHRFYGRKMLFAAVGLAAAPALSYLLAVLGLPIPVLVPAAGSVAAAAALFLVPDADVRVEARAARAEFASALTAYIELVILELQIGSGPLQALHRAAAVGDSWAFRRLEEELNRADWNGVPPWEALRGLADGLDLPDLADLAQILSMNREGAPLSASLCAKAEAMRSAQLADEVAEANAVGVRMDVPMSLMGVVFMAILIAPPLLRMMGG